MSLAKHYKACAYNNAWANHRLLRACAELSLEEFTARRTSFFPSLVATLNHILTVDWYYVDAFERAFAGREPNPNRGEFFENEQPYSACNELAAAQRAIDRRLIALCSSLDDAKLAATTASVMRERGFDHEPASRLLAHLFQHQIHHRGQAHAMLAGTRVAPPQLDEFFCVNDAKFRTQDFAELGFDEDDIWR